MKGWAIAMAIAIELVLRGMALAADPRFPDWPCNQVKVPEISVAAVWAGPAIDDVGNAWEEDAHRIRAAEKGETDICWIVQDPQS